MTKTTKSAAKAKPHKGDAIVKKGVLYIKHIPHGFYEEEMKKYFSQFGKVTNLRLSRSGKTGRSRGYAFVEFLSEDVAKIAAETMDGYLLFNKILKCSVLPRDRVPKGLFKGLNFPFPVRKEVVRIVNNRRRSAEEDSCSAQRRLARLQRSNARLSKMGLKYQFQPEVPEELLQPTEANASGSSGYNLVVDSSDTSLTFKTPPGAKRVLRKRSLVDITPQQGKKTSRQGKKTPQQGKKTPLLTSTPATATKRKKPQ